MPRADPPHNGPLITGLSGRAQPQSARNDGDHRLEADPAARATGDRDNIEVEAATATDAMAEAAASVGWGATLATRSADHQALEAALRDRRDIRDRAGCRIHRGRHFRRTRRRGRQDAGCLRYPLILLGLGAPLAGLLHWLESWLAHDIAYRLLAEMRIDLFRKLDTLAPAYLVRRRSGDLIALANQDIETIEYFFAHTVAPALVAVMVPAAVVLTLAFVSWPIALALLPFVLYAGLAPVVTRTADRPSGRASTRRPGAPQRPMLPRRSKAYPTSWRFRRLPAGGAALWNWCGSTSRSASNCCAISPRRPAQLEIVTGLGGLAVAVVGARLAAEHHLMATTLPLLILLALASFPADLGDRPGRPAAR